MQRALEYATAIGVAVVTMSATNVDAAGCDPGTIFANQSQPSLPSYRVGDGATSVTCVDINGDGHLDLLAPNYNGNDLSVLLNNGDGTFATEVRYGLGTAPSALITHDLDGDGDVDVAVTNRYGDDVSVLLNNGDGTFEQEAWTLGIVQEAHAARAINVGDFDEDGREDLVIANNPMGLRILFNQCNPCAGDLNMPADGTVDVLDLLDLLALFGSWGPCE